MRRLTGSFSIEPPPFEHVHGWGVGKQETGHMVEASVFVRRVHANQAVVTYTVLANF